MTRDIEYATIGKVFRVHDKASDNRVEIRIDFYKIPREERTQIEDAACRFFELAEEILAKEEAASGN